jgi:hypothetical protein
MSGSDAINTPVDSKVYRNTELVLGVRFFDGNLRQLSYTITPENIHKVERVVCVFAIVDLRPTVKSNPTQDLVIARNQNDWYEYHTTSNNFVFRPFLGNDLYSFMDVSIFLHRLTQRRDEFDTYMMLPKYHRLINAIYSCMYERSLQERVYESELVAASGGFFVKP